MWWFLGVMACSGLPAEGEAARGALAEALQDREPERVAAAAREASRWQGDDPALDRMLGDALANVLMRPTEGEALLWGSPAPEDPDWRRAALGAALRRGDPMHLQQVWNEVEHEDFNFSMEVVEQLAARARRDASLDPTEIARVTRQCALLDARPRVGRKELDLPLPGRLLAGARALGATEVVMGRPEVRTDPDPALGQGDLSCTGLRLVGGEEVPQPLPPRGLTVGASDGDSVLFVELRLAQGEPWVYAANDAEAGVRWVRAAGLYAEAGGGEAGVAAVRAALGEGLGGVPRPTEAP